MSSNLFPKNVFKGTNSDGSKFTAREYDFETFANIEVGSFFLMLLGGICFSAFVSPILFLITVFTFNGRVTVLQILNVLVSSYFLLDCYNGWVFLTLMSIMFSDSTLSVLVNINVAIIFVNLVLIFFGRAIYNWISYGGEEDENEGKLWIFFMGIVVVLFIFGYSRGSSITKHHPDWVNKNLQIGDYKKVEVSPDAYKTDEQIEQEAKKDYEDQLRSEGRDPKDMEYWAK